MEQNTILDQNSMKWSKLFQRLAPQYLSSLLSILYLFASACGAASAATEQIMLNSTWSDFDPVNLGEGVQTLSNHSSSGFTSAHSGAVSDLTERPRVYQEFTGVDTSQVGQKLTASFDVQFHDVLTQGDTQFRFGFGDKSTNQGLVPIMIDIGPNAGTSFRMRYDSSISVDANDNPIGFQPGNYAGFLSASGTFGNRGGNPSGDPNGGLGVDTSLTHTFTTTVERVERNVDFTFPPDGIADGVVNGWYTTVTWTSDAPEAETLFVDTNNSDFAEFDVDTGLGVYDEDFNNLRGRIENIDTLGFMFFNNQPFLNTNGSYTVSNFVVEYDDGVAVEGDYNGDGTVNAADYTVWRDNLGENLTLPGENPTATTPGVVDAEDYDFWKQNFGNPGSGAAGGIGVPEPSSLLLVLATCTLALYRRERS